MSKKQFKLQTLLFMYVLFLSAAEKLHFSQLKKIL